jgi:hypothetical protein
MIANDRGKGITINKIIDLHSHSTASDGTLSPLELWQRAQQAGVSLLALTDHDTINGVLELQSNADIPADSLVPGVEITASVDKLCVHVLGLWIDTANAELTALLAAQSQVRLRRGEAIAQRLERAGLAGALEGALSIAGDAALNRPHFARYLVQAGYCNKEQQAFKRWLGAGKIADVACQWPSVKRVVEAIHSAGGLAVLAHPDKYKLTRGKKDRLLADFKAAGGDGLELISGPAVAAELRDLAKLANKHQLACSTGSDFHSPAQSWSELGSQQQLPGEVQPIWALRSGIE